MGTGMSEKEEMIDKVLRDNLEVSRTGFSFIDNVERSLTMSDLGSLHNYLGKLGYNYESTKDRLARYYDDNKRIPGILKNEDNQPRVMFVVGALLMLGILAIAGGKRG
jgi:hypothetical protein